MYKSYIPPAKRKRKIKLPLKPYWLFLVTGAFLVSFSLYSSYQKGFKQPVQNAIVISPDKTLIKDNVVAKQVPLNAPAQIIAVKSIPVILRELPLDKGWPVRGRITTYYSSSHPAIDIAAPMGTPIRPFASGVVTSVVRGGNLGNHMTIAHANGYETLYAHMSTINVVVGQQVDPTTVIGTVGATGYATGPHLHFQLSEDGKTIDPLKVL